MPNEESKPEAQADGDAKTEEPTTEAAAAPETEEASNAAEVVAAAEAAANETEDNSKTEADKFSTVDLIKAYILNNTASTSATGDAVTSSTTAATGSTSSLVNHLTDPSMTTLLAGGEESTISTAAAVASIGAEAAGNYPPPNSKLQHLQTIMDGKMAAAGSTDATKTKEEGNVGDNITMIPLVYSVDRQEAASPTQLSMLSSALQPKSKFKNFPSVASKKRKEKSPSVKNYIEGNPNEKDVLMGRGGRSNHHPGNARYLEAKLTIQPRYRKATKEEKTGISQELVDVVKNWGGRFVKLDDTNQRWYEVDNVTARKKASQTLREENTPESRAQKRAKYSNGNTPSGRSSKTPVKPQAPGLESLAVLANAVSTDVDPEVATAMITTTDTTVDATATPVASEPQEATQEATV